MIACAALVLAARVASADVVWPALYVAAGALTWYVVAAGLLMEYPFAKYLTGMRWGSAWKPTLAINVASTAVGGLVIAIAGIAWELFPGSLIQRATNTGTFNPYTWIATFVIAVVINCGIEAVVLKVFFRVLRFRRALVWLAPANALSAGLTFCAIRGELIGFPWWPHRI